ncbi:MAG: translational GTPase TypA [Ardenticatenaceae bacterium]|nr:translational GTPase TypA [Anaerolineales bacterium]MCB8939840.1 translational GTPase TypA [Ardenticatenaceae bacterium]MCB8975078.1 translational GTPase TypA [Ardenticatenaceae bacterium]
MALQPRNDIRNIAIIAHVDHGKTTLVDGMLRQTNVFRANQEMQERVLDSNDLEKERGITILAKNTSIVYEGTTINIVDTPGHADFGGEVERVVNMVDGALLLVDAVEGPMPQTRFVLRQALDKGVKVIVVVNKIDRPAARPDFVVNATFDLFIDLGASEEQADFPVIYTKALEGKAGEGPDELADDLRPLFDTIVNYLPAPMIDPDGPTQLLVTTLEYSSYVGKIAVGRLTSGTINDGQQIMHIRANGKMEPGKITKLYTFRDLQRVEQDQVQAGDIVAIAGFPDVGIGDTLADVNDPRPLPPIKVEEPTVRMTFQVNDSPFAGKEGKFVTSRQIRERLLRELESNVAMRVEETEKSGEFIVSGRGELHLAILIETMRREGYEFAISRPEVIFKEGANGRTEPIEKLFLEVHNDYLGSVSEMLGRRRGLMQNIHYGEDGTVYAEYYVPTRGILGFRQPFLTATRGTGIYHTLFHDYEPVKGDIETQEFGSLVAMETGTVSAYGLQGLQQRGTFFVLPAEDIYSGQVVGQHIRNEDLVVNVCKTKVLSAVRTGPTAIAEALHTPRLMSLDESIEYLAKDDLLEVTPLSLRIRKKELRHEIRMREIKKAKKGA